MALLESQKWKFLVREQGQKTKSFSIETTCRKIKCGVSRGQRNTEETVRVNLPMSFFVSGLDGAMYVSGRPPTLQ